MLKRIVSAILTIVLLVGTLPQNVGAAKSDVPVIGYTLTSTKIGSKEMGETWWQTKLDKKAVFCLDLNLSCKSGDDYKVTQEWTSVTSDSTDARERYFACIGEWYAKSKYNPARWIMAQALIWGIEEGVKDEKGLKNIIQQMIEDPVTNGKTKYLLAGDKNSIYDSIFKGNHVAKYRVFDYNGDTSDDNYMQSLLEFEIDELPEYRLLSDSTNYRQRVTVYKTDEFGKPVEGAQFELKIFNYMEIANLNAGGLGGSIDTDDDEIPNKTFTSTVATDKNGRAYWRLTYQLRSTDYGYVSDNVLKNMTDSQKEFIIRELDEAGIPHPKSLKKADAEKMAQEDLNRQFNAIKNKYSIKESKSGSNKLLIPAKYSGNGDTFTITSKNSWRKGKDGWEDMTSGKKYDYEKAVRLDIVNTNKKASIKITKRDPKTDDGKPLGKGTLKGAEFGIFTDKDCTIRATVYKGGHWVESSNYKTNANGEVETDYLVPETKYYVKELKAPTGYMLNENVFDFKISANQLTAETTNVAHTVEVPEEEIYGSIGISKYHSTQKTGEITLEQVAEDSTLTPEKGAQFEIYLKQNGSYEKSREEERDLLICNSEGYAQSKELPYGTYVIHQISCGFNADGTDIDAEFIDDQEVEVLQQGQKIDKIYLNQDFTAYLRVRKVLKETGETVIKPNTTYEIYKINADGSETKVVQQHVVDNELQEYDKFVSDETGLIETYNPLMYGSYKVYEIEAPEGTYIATDCYTITISSKNDKIKQYTDADGNIYYQAELDYVNESTRAQFTLSKQGEKLVGYSPEDGFTYQMTNLDGVKFNVYAKEDIATADGQETLWFEKGDLVATIITGQSVEFTKECGGICRSGKDENGNCVIEMPLGEYEVKEEGALEGYLLTDEVFDLKFLWDNSKDATVYNATDITDDKGVLTVFNERQKTDVSIYKGTEGNENLAVPNTTFGLYNKDEIKDASGNVLVEANTLLETVTTNEDGNAVVTLDLPLGEYYFVEQHVSDSYYLDPTPIEVDLSYNNKLAATPVLTANAVQTNKITEFDVDKLKLSNGEALKDAYLQIVDSKNNVIVSWITGKEGSIKISENLDSLKYANLSVKMKEDGNISVTGLFHDEKYSLVETKPADGYVTAENITFMITEKDTVVTSEGEGEGTEGSEESNYVLKVLNTQTGVFEEVDKVVMYDDSTKIYVSKKDITNDEELAGCEMQITDEDGKVIESWTTTNEPKYFEAKFVVGKKYTLTETRPVDGYTTAVSIDFVIKDTGLIQTVTMTDAPTSIEVSKVDVTGENEIEGCKLKVIDKKTGKTIDSWTSKAEKHIITGKLVIGETYILQEELPAKGYVTAQDVEFTVEDNLGEIQRVVMVDEYTQVKIVKVDANDTTKRLKGAEFVFKNKDGVAVAKLVTDENGEAITIGVLEINETYTVIETQAPVGFDKTSDFEYTVVDTADIQVLTVKDKPNITKTGIVMKSFQYGFIIIGIVVAMILVMFGFNTKKKPKKK